MSHLKKIAAVGLTLTTMVSMFPMTAMAATKDGWKKEKGKWYYYERGIKLKYQSIYDPEDCETYVVDGTGARVTKKGLLTLDKVMTEHGDKIKFKTSYYLLEGGKVKFGWKKIKGKYYYFEPGTGKMLKGGLVDLWDDDEEVWRFQLVGNDGARILKKGWYTVKHTDVDEYNGDKITYKNSYYVLDEGYVATDCVKSYKGKKYVLCEDGHMVTNGTYTKSGKTYLYGSDGARITKKGWAKVTAKYSYTGANYSYKDSGSTWYYLKKDATVTMGWKKIDGKWYYFSDSDGSMYRDVRSYIMGQDGVYRSYIFNKTGACVNY